MPDMVQVGNEITNGMLWPKGSNSSSWANFGQLVNSAIRGVRDAEIPGERIPVAIHINNAGQSGLPQWFFNNFASQSGVTDYDIMGLSYYPTVNDNLNTMKSNLNYLATHYDKKIMILETGYPWKGTSGTGPYPVTAAGQEQFLTDLAIAVHDLPNNAGEGFVYWYPESIQVPGTWIWKGGAYAFSTSKETPCPRWMPSALSRRARSGTGSARQTARAIGAHPPIGIRNACPMQTTTQSSVGAALREPSMSTVR